MSNLKLYKPVVVIPTHKANPEPEEIVSLQQCQKILGSRDIYLMVPKGLNIQAYTSILPNAKFYEVPPECMSSHHAYNQLMISPRIFTRFRDYSHILIHEPDSIVLKDELDFWCSQKFDYIGAPWFKKDSYGIPRLDATGNFGFALLNTKSINQIFRDNRRWYSPSMIARDLFRGLRGRTEYLPKALKAIGDAGRVAGAYKLYTGHCDIFWCCVIPKISPNFKIAPPQDALNFSWETNLINCAAQCTHKIPFGIHAWAKHDPNFLKSIFLEVGVSLESDYDTKEA